MLHPICCFCGLTAGPYGNNPEPASLVEGAVSCDSCNARLVIPARLKLHMEEEKKKAQKEAEA